MRLLLALFAFSSRKTIRESRASPAARPKPSNPTASHRRSLPKAVQNPQQTPANPPPNQIPNRYPCPP
jgi:hypothetical protein